VNYNNANGVFTFVTNALYMVTVTSSINVAATNSWFSVRTGTPNIAGVELVRTGTLDTQTTASMATPISSTNQSKTLWVSFINNSGGTVSVEGGGGSLGLQNDIKIIKVSPNPTP
jgi:hypothetical protein